MTRPSKRVVLGPCREGLSLIGFVPGWLGIAHWPAMSPMLFILVMNVLNLMVAKASNEGLLQPLSLFSIQHRISLCVDDVVLFLCRLLLIWYSL
jgi:hypothetical protein